MNQSIKRVLFVSVVMLLAASVFGQTAPIDEDAMNAFGVSFGAYIMSAMMTAFGQPVPGFTMTESGDSGTMRFDNMDLSNLGEEAYGYSSMSGEIIAREASEGATMEADLRLTGGPVKNLQWSVENFDMTDETAEVTFTIIADGKRYQVTNTDFMM